MPLSRNELNKLLNETGPGNRKTQWKRLVLKMHPNKGGNSNRFKNLSAAYNAYYKGKETGSASTNATARAYANTAKNAAFAQAMNNFLHPKRKPPPPPPENEKRYFNILAKKMMATRAWSIGSDPIHVKLNKSPIIRFKNQGNINFFRTRMLHPHSHLTGQGNGRKLVPNHNYYFIPTRAVKNNNHAKIFLLNIGRYSTYNKLGLANKNILRNYFGLK